MRVGVSCVLVVILVLAAMPIVPLLYPDGSVVRASPVWNPDEMLIVDDTYVITGYEVWRGVEVRSTALLMVSDGGKLVTERIVLQGNSRFSVLGAVVELSPTRHMGTATISGICSYFDVKDQSVVRIRGPDGGYDLPTSMGGSVGINITANRYIQVSDSFLDLRAGDGLSPQEPMTQGDLDGRAFAGGDVELSLVCKSPYELLFVVGTDIHLRAGDGGTAPDAETPPLDPEARVKGLGGGYTRGGDVSDLVGSGGSVSMRLEALHSLEVSNCFVNVTAGDGGDGGDGASVLVNGLSGAGGGGYTGGDGASGLAEQLGAMPGGSVIGDVGRGGDISISIDSPSVDLRTARFDVLAGDGGSGGDGGHSSGMGGGGGGGYTGGGGGSYLYMAGAPGGNVVGDVGRGGRVTMDVEGSDDMEVKSSRFWLRGGYGGDGGNGGNGSQDGGGGGGGFTGGGGGSGDSGEQTTGKPGGDGGPVTGRVGKGGSASLNFSSDRFVSLSSWFEVAGGTGGSVGLPGSTYVLPGGSYGGGGGAGGHSAGGGGGAGQSTRANEHGGDAGTVIGEVGDGGDSSFVIESERASIHRNTIVYNKWGPRGIVVNSSAAGDTGGTGNARDTYEGTVHEHIPMSMPILWAPADEEYLSIPPRFDWMPVYRSTTNGDVDYYLFVLSTDNTFEDPMVVTALDHPGWFDRDLPMGTYYWKVTAIYIGPPNAEGPVPHFHWFRYFNAPPVVMKEPTIEVVEGIFKSVYLGNYVHDPDTPLQSLCVTCEHGGVDSIMGLFLTLFYPEYIPSHAMRYWISDGNSNVSGILNIIVLDANERPVIHDVGGYDSNDTILLREGSDVFLEVNATDPNDDPLNYSVRGTWGGISMSPLGTLHVSATKEDLGMHVFSVVVEDDEGEADTMRLKVLVENAKEPPLAPELFSPKNGSKWKEGQEITFTVKVSDPDIVHGEVLTVTWTSNISGTIGSVGTTEMAYISTNRLPVGEHRVHITVSDGAYETFAYVDITVVERDDPGPPPARSDLWMYIVFALIFVAMIVIGYQAGTRGAQDELEG